MPTQMPPVLRFLSLCLPADQRPVSSGRKRQMAHAGDVPVWLPQSPVDYSEEVYLGA